MSNRQFPKVLLFEAVDSQFNGRKVAMLGISKSWEETIKTISSYFGIPPYNVCLRVGMKLPDGSNPLVYITPSAWPGCVEQFIAPPDGAVNVITVTRRE